MGFQSCRYNTKKLAEILGIEVDVITNALKDSRIGGFAKVWSVGETKETKLKNGQSILLCAANVSTGSKEESGTYKNDFQDGYVTFWDSACKKINELEIPQNGLSIQIVSCGVTNNYDKKNKKFYTNYTIYDFDVTEYKNSNDGNKKSANFSKVKAKTKATVTQDEDDEDDLPF